MSDPDLKPLSPGMTAAASALFILFWASGFISAKYGFPYAEPFTFLSLRFAIALAVLLPMVWIWRARWPATPALFGHVVVAGFLVQTVYLIGVFYGIWYGISTGVIALLVGVQPLITGALAGPILGEKVTPRQWAGLALGFTGLSMVVMEKIDFSGSGAIGVAFGAFALAGITIGTLYQKRFCAEVDIRTAVTIQNGTSLVVIGALAVLFETGKIDWTGEFLFALIWSAIGLSVIAIALYFLLVRQGNAAKVTSLLYLSPPTTAIMGWFIFDETFPPLALAGLVIAVLGVALANRK
jgi:drug/metabolite transporter (DMT)-like permease